MTTTPHYDRPGAERAERYDPAEAARRAAAYAARHPEAVTDSPPEPLTPVRPAQGACRCPRGAVPDSRPLMDCACEWDELISALLHLAYGADPSTIAAAGPAIAAMAHDIIYCGRNAALRVLADQYAGTRTAFAKQHNLSRSQLYNIID